MDTVAMKQAMINALEYQVEALHDRIQLLENTINDLNHNLEMYRCPDCVTPKCTATAAEPLQPY